MRITKGQTVCGVDALALRSALRGWHTYSVEWFAQELGLEAQDALRLVQALCAEGFIRPDGESSDFYVLTTKGSALRMASAARPITRATATRLVREIVHRAHEVNEGEYAYNVRALVVFGSYCDLAVERLSDVDIAVRLVEVDDFDSVREERIRLAYAGGRQFSSDLDEMFWPLTEVKRHLRGRSASISLHSNAKTFDLATSGPHEYVYLQESSASD